MVIQNRARDAAFAWQVMREAPYATLSLVAEDGTPYAVPVSPVADEAGNRLYFHCAQMGRKHDLFACGCPAVLSAVSRAVVIPEEYTVDYASAVARGQLEIVTGDAERMEAMRLLCNHYAPTKSEKFASCMKNSGAVTCVVRLAVEEITGKEYC